MGRPPVSRITADTNIRVRAITDDDPVQSPLAKASLAEAERVAITVPTLCELVWVLTRAYRLPRAEVSDIIRKLAAAANVATDNSAVAAGLALMDAGGDFADGVIAFGGRWLGAETFVSFDAEAVRLLTAQGVPAKLL
jgi:predicted nucleic-acid-binding protein